MRRGAGLWAAPTASVGGRTQVLLGGQGQSAPSGHHHQFQSPDSLIFPSGNLPPSSPPPGSPHGLDTDLGTPIGASQVTNPHRLRPPMRPSRSGKHASDAFSPSSPWPLIPECQEVLPAICPPASYLDLKGLVSSSPPPPPPTTAGPSCLGPVVRANVGES